MAYYDSKSFGPDDTVDVTSHRFYACSFNDCIMVGDPHFAKFDRCWFAGRAGKWINEHARADPLMVNLSVAEPAREAEERVMDFTGKPTVFPFAWKQAEDREAKKGVMEVMYVVLGECGDCSDRNVWVSGVFADISSAKKAVEEATRRRNLFDQWYVSFLEHLRQIKGSYWGIATDAEEAEANRLAGPKPEYEPAERTEIFKAELGRWNAIPSAPRS